MITGFGAAGAGEWWTTPDGKSKRFLHSPATLATLLKAAGFTDVDVQVRHQLETGILKWVNR